MMLNNIAVLIDGDNASSKNIGAILNKISEFGTITLKKIYGDWSQTNLSGWQEAILQYAIDPMQQFAYVKGKNATDIALVIEAMDLLHSNKYDAFCLVSSDSDFTSLALRIRKNDIKVFGFGKQTTVKSLQTACDEFFLVESLINTQQPIKENSKTAEPWSSEKLKNDTKLINALKDIITNTPKQKGNWLNYGTFGQEWKKKYAHISPKQYGYSKFINIIEKLDVFDILREPSAIYIGLKEKKHGQVIATKSSTKILQNDKALVDAITAIIQENTQSKDDWINLSHLSSQLQKNYPNIDTKKHGYKKFSELIAAIRLFDIKKNDKGIYLKLKSQPQSQKHSSTLPAEASTKIPAHTQNNQQPKSIFVGQIEIQVYATCSIDSVLWRLTANKKVRHDGDIIFYGQTHTSNDTIVLNNTDAVDGFYCDLDKQDDDVSYLLLTASHENAAIDTPIKIIIKQNGETFYDDTYTPTQSANSVLLFALAKTKDGWKIGFEYRPVPRTLLQLCQFFGVEVE